MTKEEAKKFGLQLLHGIMERNGSYPVYANNVKQAIEALSEPDGSSEIPNDLEEAAKAYADDTNPTDSFYEAFKEGALWMREQMMKELSEKIASAYQLGLADKEKKTVKEAEKPCHTVEEWMEHIKNADQLTKDIFSKGPYNVLYDALNHPYRDCYDAIKEFGELCYQTAREDMMKEAVDVQVVGEQRDLRLTDSTQRCLFNANRGDWLKIIIVKED